ncbi:MAG: hypothetical protein DHS20C21_00090 [Gemmatimonadota bacterium]|nr:MAG: hypothetical protein DHS20C21_00090 [Gemmatimonadota bacterium]
MAVQSNDAAAVRIFPPAVPLGVVVLGVVLHHLAPIELDFSIPRPERYWIGGLIVAGAVLGLGLPSVVMFRRGGQSENPWKPTTHIEERGPFRVTRNPMYVQMLVTCLGLAVVLMNWWVMILTPIGALLLRQLVILPEEEYLERKFGDSYRSYKSRVRRWL